jgi:purine-nucleoside phosphorylase
MSTYSEKLSEALKFIHSKQTQRPEIGLILGSGLGSFADTLQNKTIISTSDIPHYPVSTVAGHSGEIVFGELAGKHICALKGRTHAYEGYSQGQVTFCIRLMKLLGIGKIVITNAAGGVNRDFKAGDLMAITDHINFTFKNPLIGKNLDEFGKRFPDMSAPYDASYIKLAESEAINLGFTLRRGVYLGVMGPNYETAADIRMIALMGGDAVGMSTVPDVIAASHAGMRILGITCVTNMGTGISPIRLTHEEVTEMASQSKTRFESLLTAIIPQM